MDQSPYAPPESDLRVEEQIPQSQFYVVSTKKFTVLFLFTLGLYSVYWFYQNWQYQRRRTGAKIWPVARAVFSIFFAHELFREIQKSLSDNGKAFHWQPATQATAYVLLSIATNGLDRLAAKSIGSPYTDVLSLTLFPLLLLTLITPQKAINMSQGDPEGKSNSRFTAANYAWIILGGTLWALSLLGLAEEFGLVNME